MTASIIPERLQRLLSDDAHLVSGAGSGINGAFDACIMQAVDWLAGGDGKTDAPECADRVIRRFCIRLNDSSAFAQYRDELKPFAEKIVNTNEGVDLMRKRAFMVSDWAVRTVLPIALERIDKPELAAKAREIPEIVDRASALAARDAAREIRTSTRELYYAKKKDAADADAYAAYAAYAADAAAYAAYAAYAAAYAADAAAYAKIKTADEDTKRKLWDESLAMLQRLIDAKL